MTTKQTSLDLKLYEKRISATEALVSSGIDKDERINKTYPLEEEQTKIQKLHDEIKAGLKTICEWEINLKFGTYMEQLAGNDILALAPSILSKIEDLINKHIVFFYLMLN